MAGEQERPTDAVPLSEPALSELPTPNVDIPEQLPMAQERTLVEDDKVLHRPPARERLIRTRNTMPDYGWLAESLWAKVERLKRYPPIARMNRWEGKVVLQAVIREDAGCLMWASWKARGTRCWIRTPWTCSNKSPR
jgi:protein TonB